jgi:hypothetical protein
MGEVEESFFAELTGYQADQDAKTTEDGKGVESRRYKWKALNILLQTATNSSNRIILYQFNAQEDRMAGSYYTDIETWSYDEI